MHPPCCHTPHAPHTPHTTHAAVHHTCVCTMQARDLQRQRAHGAARSGCGPARDAGRPAGGAAFRRAGAVRAGVRRAGGAHRGPGGWAVLQGSSAMNRLVFPVRGRGVGAGRTRPLLPLGRLGGRGPPPPPLLIVWCSLEGGRGAHGPCFHGCRAALSRALLAGPHLNPPVHSRTPSHLLTPTNTHTHTESHTPAHTGARPC